MKNKINIFSDKKIKFFFSELFSDYELFFKGLSEIQNYIENNSINIIVLNDDKNANLFNFKKLKGNYLLISNIINQSVNINNHIIKTPTPINQIKTITENFVENIKVIFHDITIINEKMTNINNNSFCYLTKLESEILSYLIYEKEGTKNYIQENILNIKSTIKTNSLDSHLTRIRKKMSQIKTNIKIQSKSDKLLITI